MAYSIVTENKKIDIIDKGVTLSHISTLYGGIKNSLGQITDNLQNPNLLEAIVDLPEWCSIKLDPVGDNTAVKVLATCKENIATISRICNIRLKYNDKTTPIKMTINLLGKSSTPTPEPEPVEPSKTYLFKIGFPRSSNFIVSSITNVYFGLSNELNGRKSTNILPNGGALTTDNEWSYDLNIIFSGGIPAYTSNYTDMVDLVIPGSKHPLYLYIYGQISGSLNGYGVWRATEIIFNNFGNNVNTNGTEYMLLPPDRSWEYNDDTQNYEATGWCMVTNMTWMGAG